MGKSIASVLHEVKNAQSILNRMDNGSRCAKKGQASVTNAKASLRQKRAAEKQAHKNLSKSRNAKITHCDLQLGQPQLQSLHQLKRVPEGSSPRASQEECLDQGQAAGEGCQEFPQED